MSADWLPTPPEHKQSDIPLLTRFFPSSLHLLCAGPPIEHRGYKMVDAAVFQPVPVQAALEGWWNYVCVMES